MSENSLKETVTRLATPLVQAQGLEIWGVEIAQAGRTTVRVFVDLPLEVKQAQAALSADSDPADNLEDSADIMTARSASIDQCEEISRQLGLALEVEDLIEQAYVLEVSTPGFSRLFFSLDQMRSYVGDMVELRMVSAYAPETPPRPVAPGAASCAKSPTAPCAWPRPASRPRATSAPRPWTRSWCPGTWCAAPAASIFSASRRSPASSPPARPPRPRPRATPPRRARARAARASIPAATRPKTYNRTGTPCGPLTRPQGRFVITRP